MLRLGTVEVRASPYEIRDRRGKILAHLVKEQVLAGNGAGRGRTVAATVRVLPLRGYERVADSSGPGVPVETRRGAQSNANPGAGGSGTSPAPAEEPDQEEQKNA